MIIEEAARPKFHLNREEDIPYLKFFWIKRKDSWVESLGDVMVNIASVI